MIRVSIGFLAGAVGFGIIAGAAIGAQTEAQGLVTIQKLSAPLANELVGEAVANCAQKGYAVTAAVVDLDGVRQPILRGNGAPIHTLDNAYYKGYSAASVTHARKEDSTKAVADRMSKNQAGRGEPRTPETDSPVDRPERRTASRSAATAEGLAGFPASTDRLNPSPQNHEVRGYRLPRLATSAKPDSGWKSG